MELPRRQLLRHGSVAFAVGATGCSGSQNTPLAADDRAETGYSDYDMTEVRVLSPENDELGVVTAAIADTPKSRYLGLSNAESLREDRGMLFVFDENGKRTFVMRDMSFGIDIIYADGDGVITEIHHAPEPAPNEDGTEQEYPGRGQYVLEVTKGWTTDHNVSAGDRIAADGYIHK